MQESQYESTPTGSAPKGAGGFVATVIRWVGAIVSVGLAAGIVYWAVMLGQRDASQVPVIRAMEGEARIAPEDPGGTQAQYQGLAVNEVLAENTPSAVETQSTLAPAEQSVTPEDESMGTLEEQQPAAPVEPVRVDASSMLVEVDDNGEVLPDTPVAPDGMTLPVRRPDSFNNLGGSESDIINDLLLQANPEEGDTSLDVPEIPRPAPLYGNPYLNPGDALVQLGAFASLEDAAGVWTKYRNTQADLLAGLERVIEPVEAGGRLLYQLRAAGLADVDAARALCAALDARGADCLALTQK